MFKQIQKINKLLKFGFYQTYQQTLSCVKLCYKKIIHKHNRDILITTISFKYIY